MRLSGRCESFARLMTRSNQMIFTRLKNETGNRYGRLTVLGPAEKKGCWLTQCDCNNGFRIADGRELRAKRLKACRPCARTHQREIAMKPRPRRNRRRPPAERVLRAIRAGARTQKEIEYRARVKPDQLGQILAELMFDRGEVGTEVVGGVRRYFEMRTRTLVA